MSILKEIQSYSKEAANVLYWAGLQSDSDLRSLTREDLNELLPGPKMFKHRRMIFATINSHNTQKVVKQVNKLLKELQGFIPHDSLRAALTDNGVLVDYLHVLKDMKKQMNDVQTFLDAHISLLEDIRKPQPEPQPDRGACSARNPPASQDLAKPHNELIDWRLCEEQSRGQHQSGLAVPAGSMTGIKRQTDNCAQRIAPKYCVMPAPLYYNEVIYKPVVCGKTFNADKQLMDSMRSQVQDLVRITEWNPDLPDHQVNIIFCPVSSRVGTDAAEALTYATDNKPVILVLMHHAHQPKPVSSLGTSAASDNVVLYVSVFYHEAKSGLLKCKDNDDAVSQIQNKLKEYMTQKANTVNTQDEIAESQETGGISGDDNVRASPTDSGSRGFSRFLPSFRGSYWSDN
ncbi:uncharacterized protein LOC114428701 isoform X2 [Parambassis ranga]|uniref:Uncharacterized protein LOC114428701 isoform X2 n=1 Tax=Parambassis ranga TaxID=210632 RepID=A0A6P7HMD0_9TELE|nr:uncharacterized protein LOC114428701 isoform X2 [Parambassis ranga]